MVSLQGTKQVGLVFFPGRATINARGGGSQPLQALGNVRWEQGMLMEHGRGHLLPTPGVCRTQLLQDQSQAGLVQCNSKIISGK